MTPQRPNVAPEAVDGAPSAPAAGPTPLLPGDLGPDEVSLHDYLDVLVAGRRLVAIAVAVSIAAGIAYALFAAPVYRSDALVQVEDPKGKVDFLGDLSAAFGQSSPAETEIEILRSRALVGSVVRELGLHVVARPKRFPIVGGAVARRYDEAGVAGAVLGLSSFGWGGERIAVDRLEVPRELVAAALSLVAGDGGRYVLRGPDGETILAGEVGRAAAAGGVEIFVSELRARPGLEFAVTRRDRDEVVAELQDDLKISEKGKKTGVIRLALDGDDPARVAAILDSLSRWYVRQNVERRSAEAQKTLKFLEGQLPELRASLDAAEAELKGYRSRTGSVDISLEAQAAVTRAVEIEKAASQLEVERAALRQKFTADHPAMVAVLRQLQQLEAERAGLESRLKKLPATELESVRRLRDVKVANELYLIVLNKAQELKVVKEGEIGNVRVLDAAIVPKTPVSPRKSNVVALSVALGLALGVGAAFGRRALEEGVEDPDAVERVTGVDVNASIPHSRAQEELERRSRRDRLLPPLLGVAEPKDLAIESLRSLRTSLQFALVEARNGIVAVGGPAPLVGKSFVTANLAHLLGEGGKRVLVVDADLRRGRLHRYFGMERGTGLSDAIAGEVPVQDVLRRTGSPNVTLLGAGTIPPNPAEMLGSERFQCLLEQLAAAHDVVLVDTPPILAVTDAALVARHAGVTLFVLRSGKHPMREIGAAIRQFGRDGIRVQGIVMNDVPLGRGLGRRNYYYYHYKYG